MDDILGYVSQIELMAGVPGLIRHDLRGQGCSFACARIGRSEFTQPRQTAKVIIAKPHTIAATPSQKSGIIISLGLTWRSADAFRHLITRSNLVGWPGANQPAFRFCDLLYVPVRYTRFPQRDHERPPPVPAGTARVLSLGSSPRSSRPLKIAA
jgi:hypothetical protein